MRRVPKQPRRFTVAAVLLSFAMMNLSGCIGGDNGSSTGEAGHSANPLATQFTFGAAGTSLGQFNYPRCIAVDPVNHWVYVVDKSARVQRFNFEGQPLTAWSTPEWANGKPTGVSVAPDGRVFVAERRELGLG